MRNKQNIYTGPASTSPEHYFVLLKLTAPLLNKPAFTGRLYDVIVVVRRDLTLAGKHIFEQRTGL